MDQDESQECTKCSEKALLWDRDGGFLVCSACGFMPDSKAQSLTAPLHDRSGQALSTYVRFGSTSAAGKSYPSGRGADRYLRGSSLERHRRGLMAKCSFYMDLCKLPKCKPFEPPAAPPLPILFLGAPLLPPPPGV